MTLVLAQQNSIYQKMTTTIKTVLEGLMLLAQAHVFLYSDSFPETIRALMHYDDKLYIGDKNDVYRDLCAAAASKNITENTDIVEYAVPALLAYAGGKALSRRVRLGATWDVEFIPLPEYDDVVKLPRALQYTAMYLWQYLRDPQKQYTHISSSTANDFIQCDHQDRLMEYIYFPVEAALEKKDDCYDNYQFDDVFEYTEYLHTDKGMYTSLNVERPFATEFTIRSIFTGLLITLDKSMKRPHELWNGDGCTIHVHEWVYDGKNEEPPVTLEDFYADMQREPLEAKLVTAELHYDRTWFAEEYYLWNSRKKYLSNRHTFLQYVLPAIDAFLAGGKLGDVIELDSELDTTAIPASLDIPVDESVRGGRVTIASALKLMRFLYIAASKLEEILSHNDVKDELDRMMMTDEFDLEHTSVSKRFQTTIYDNWTLTHDRQVVAEILKGKGLKNVLHIRPESTHEG
jgi:hypothetical protein